MEQDKNHVKSNLTFRNILISNANVSSPKWRNFTCPGNIIQVMKVEPKKGTPFIGREILEVAFRNRIKQIFYL